MPVASAEREVRPSRLNFAGVCLWCGRRWCASGACVARHEASLWVVCPTCHGFRDRLDDCCVYGVVAAGPALMAEQAARVLPTAPAAEPVVVVNPELGPENDRWPSQSRTTIRQTA